VGQAASAAACLMCLAGSRTGFLQRRGYVHTGLLVFGALEDITCFVRSEGCSGACRPCWMHDRWSNLLHMLDSYHAQVLLTGQLGLVPPAL
jgi:hypothetical protein